MVCNIDYRNSFFFSPHFKTCGVNCSQFLSRDSSYQGHSVNQNYYTAMASMKKKGIKNDLKSGTQGTGHSIITMQLVTPFCACEFLAKNKMTVIPNPVLMPCDTFLIKKKKKSGNISRRTCRASNNALNEMLHMGLWLKRTMIQRLKVYVIN